MHNIITCGMQFGDEGKGTFGEYLAKKYKANWIVLYNGGSQASHTVVRLDGTIHKFSQLGSGFFEKDIKLYIGIDRVVNLDNLFTEIKTLSRKTHISEKEIINRIYFNYFSLIVTPYHKLLNKLREISLGKKKRGSVGTGVSEVPYLEYISDPDYKNGKTFQKYGGLFIFVGELIGKRREATRGEVIGSFESLRNYVKDFYLYNEKKIKENMSDSLKEELEKEIQFLLFDEDRPLEIAKSFIEKSKILCEKYPGIEDRVVEDYPWYEELIGDSIDKDIVEELYDSTFIYEGSQGLLIDGKYGLRPNTTHLQTSNHEAVNVVNALKDRLCFDSSFIIRKIGIAKAFYSRHGEGVFPTESNELEKYISDENQEETIWNGKIRFGWFDAILFRYAQRINKVSETFMSSLDKLNGFANIKVCNSYKYTGEVDDTFKKLFNYYVDAKGNIIITDIRRSYKNISRYLKNCKPIYIEVKGWYRAVYKSVDNYQDTLSVECENYLRLIQSLTGVPITCISFGPTINDKMQL